jgi:hypothetical protein
MNKSVSFLALCLAVMGCSRTTEIGCDPCTTSAIVYGTVRTSDGAPIAAARIDVDAYLDQCSGPHWGQTNVPAQSDVDGRYRSSPSSPAAPFSACVVVRVTPPSGSSFASAASSGAFVQFRDSRSTGLDSSRVDIALAASN